MGPNLKFFGDFDKNEYHGVLGLMPTDLKIKFAESHLVFFCWKKFEKPNGGGFPKFWHTVPYARRFLNLFHASNPRKLTFLIVQSYLGFWTN